MAHRKYGQSIKRSAGRGVFPSGFAPMLATLGQIPADDGAYAYEFKWDGVRALGFSTVGGLRLLSRNGLDITARYPELQGIARQLGKHDAVLDGEIVAFDDDGAISFSRLQRRMHVDDPAQLARARRAVPVSYLLFDILSLDGEPLIDRPYLERRGVLENLGLAGAYWFTPPYELGNGVEIFEAACGNALEGIVAKRLDSRYEPGARSSAWLKIKNIAQDEFVIGGWMPGQGNRASTMGSLLLGEFVDGSDDAPLRYAGRVGTGFDVETLNDLMKRMTAIESTDSPFNAPVPEARRVHYTRPELVADIAFGERTVDGILRHPVYRGLRTDKSAREILVKSRVPLAAS